MRSELKTIRSRDNALLKDDKLDMVIELIQKVAPDLRKQQANLWSFVKRFQAVNRFCKRAYAADEI